MTIFETAIRWWGRLSASRFWKVLRPIFEYVFDNILLKVLAIMRNDALDVIAEIADEITSGKYPLDEVDDIAARVFREKMRERLSDKKYDEVRDAITDYMLNIAREIFYGFYKKTRNSEDS